MQDDFDLTDYIPYLVNRAGVRLAEPFSAFLRRDHGITLQTWRVLAALWHSDGQRVGELSSTTSIEVSTLSRLLTTMAAKDLIERHRPATGAGSGDARVVEIRLTESARVLTQRILPAAKRYQRMALEGFSPEEERLLQRLLTRLYDNMERQDLAAPSESDERAAANPPRRLAS